MLCRAMLAVAAVTYLLCVLLLSGIQKEDLDESTLQKLQRQNVNINNLNNEELKNNCTNFELSKNDSTQGYITVNRKDIQNVTQNITINILNNKNVKEQSNSLNDSKTLYTKNKEERETKKKEMNNNSSEICKEIIQYTDGQPKLKSVIKFWEDCVNIKNHSNNNLIEKRKRNIPNKISTAEVELLSNLFSLKNISKQMPDLGTTTKIIESPDENNTRAVKNILEQLILNNKNAMKNSITKKNEEKLTELKMQYLQDTMSNYNRKMVNSDAFPMKSENTNNVRNNLQVPGNILPKQDVGQNRITIYNEQKKIQDPSNTIPHNIIKEIAEGIKAIILKDLRNEFNILTTTSSTTIAPTERTKVTLELGSHQILNVLKNITTDKSTISKFMKLLEQEYINDPKNIKQNNKELTNNLMERDYEKHEQMHYNEFNDESLKRMERTNANIFEKISITTDRALKQRIYNFGIQMHKYRSIPIKEKEMKKSKQVKQKTNYPITFQTNSLEIPPLGIVLDNIQNPINQNIVLKSVPREVNKLNKNIHITNDPIFNKYNAPPFQSKKVVEQLNINQRDNNYHKEFNPNRYQTYDFGRNRMVNIPRQYGNLESMDEKIPQGYFLDKSQCCNAKYVSQLMEECCNDRIISRQQLSLNNEKIPYDDTHLRSFIKSQQKVNDMLERILSARNKFRSVEHI